MKLKTKWLPADIKSRLPVGGGLGFLFHAPDFDSLSCAFEGADFSNAVLWDEPAFIGGPVFFENRIIGAHVCSPLPASLWAGSHSGIRRFRRSGFEPCLQLAREAGLVHVGLGALVPFATDFGRCSEASHGLHLTTGHATTVAAIRQTVAAAAKTVGFDPATLCFAIFGAAGSIGANTARWFLRTGINRLVLVDIPQRRSLVETLADELRLADASAFVECFDSAHFEEIPEFHCGIVATSSPQPWIDREFLSRTPLWIDDSHPCAASIQTVDELADSFLYLECFLRGPHSLCQTFPFRLPTSRDCYSCFAETFICWRLGENSNHVVGPATLKQIAFMDEQLHAHGFTAGPLTQKTGAPVSEPAIKRCRSLLRNRD